MRTVQLTSTAGSPQAVSQNVNVFAVILSNDGSAGTAGRVLIEDASAVDGPENLGATFAGAGDASESGGVVTYLDSTHAGTITQTSGNLAVALVPFTRYAFTYTIADLVGAPAGTITTGVATAAATLDLSEGTHTVEFTTKAVPGNFVLSFTSTDVPDPEAFTISGLSLVQIARTWAQFPDPGTQHGQWPFVFDEPLRIDNNLGLNVRIVTSDHLIVTVLFE